MSAAPLNAAQTTATPAQAQAGTHGVSASAAAHKGQAGPVTGFQALLAMLDEAEQGGAAAAPGAAGPKTAVKASGDAAKGNDKTGESKTSKDAKDDPDLAVANDATGQTAVAAQQVQQVVPVAAGALATQQPPAIAAEAPVPSKAIATGQGAPQMAAAANVQAAIDAAKDTASLATATVGAQAIAASPATAATTPPADSSRAAAPVAAPPTPTTKPDATALAPQAPPVAQPGTSAPPPQPAAPPAVAPQAMAPQATAQAAMAADTAIATAGAAPQVAAQAAGPAKPSVTPASENGASSRIGAAPAAKGGRTAPQAFSGGEAISTRMADATQAQAKAEDATADGDGAALANGAASEDIQASTAETPSDANPGLTAATNATTTPAATHTATAEVRGQPQTVAALSAQIIKKLDGRSTQFDVALDPVGLGHVNVRVQIGAGGKMSAALAFDNPKAAAELRGRASELQSAMEQAGFDLSGGLSFDVAGDPGQGPAGQQQQPAPTFRGRAFQTAQDTTGDPVASGQFSYRRSSASGVDVRI